MHQEIAVIQYVRYYFGIGVLVASICVIHWNIKGHDEDNEFNKMVPSWLWAARYVAFALVITVAWPFILFNELRLKINLWGN